MFTLPPRHSCDDRIATADVMHAQNTMKNQSLVNHRTGLATADSDAMNYNVHVFYYPWYGNPTVDGQYIHWNHEIVPHWRASVAEHYPTGWHSAPDDIGAKFYPRLGPYSSRDPAVIDSHMKQIRSSGAGWLF